MHLCLAAPSSIGTSIGSSIGSSSVVGLDDALRGQSRRTIILFSDIGTIASITLVSKEMRGAFIDCKDDLVPRLLDQRSPRMAKVLKCLKEAGCEVTDDVTDLYRRTVAAENLTTTALRWSPSPTVDLGTVNLSFEFAISDTDSQSLPYRSPEFQADRVASWAGPLGPHFLYPNHGGDHNDEISIRIPPDAIRDLELPLVWSDEVEDILQHGTVPDWYNGRCRLNMRMKVYLTAATERGVLTTKLYDGEVEDRHNEDAEVVFTDHDIGDEDGRNPFESSTEAPAHDEDEDEDEDEAVHGEIQALLHYRESGYTKLVNGDKLKYDFGLMFRIVTHIDSDGLVYTDGLYREQSVLFMKNIVASMSQ